MTSLELQEYIEATRELTSLKERFDILSTRLNGLTHKARYLILPEGEVVVCHDSVFYRIYIDVDDDIQVNPIRCI